MQENQKRFSTSLGKCDSHFYENGSFHNRESSCSPKNSMADFEKPIIVNRFVPLYENEYFLRQQLAAAAGKARGQTFTEAENDLDRRSSPESECNEVYQNFLVVGGKFTDDIVSYSTNSEQVSSSNSNAEDDSAIYQNLMVVNGKFVESSMKDICAMRRQQTQRSVDDIYSKVKYLRQSIIEVNNLITIKPELKGEAPHLVEKASKAPTISQPAANVQDENSWVKNMISRFSNMSKRNRLIVKERLVE